MPVATRSDQPPAGEEFLDVFASQEILNFEHDDEEEEEYADNDETALGFMTATEDELLLMNDIRDDKGNSAKEKEKNASHARDVGTIQRTR